MRSDVAVLRKEESGHSTMNLLIPCLIKLIQERYLPEKFQNEKQTDHEVIKFY